jgi:DNA-binding transcriptional LysR family regulator
MRVLNRPIDPVEEGVDLALRVRPTIEDSATLVAKNFGVSRGLLAASPELLQRVGPVRTPHELERLDTVAMSAAGDGRTSLRLEGPDGAVHVLHHVPRYVADDLSSLRFAVLAGIGVGVLPDYMCRADLREGRLVEVLPAWGPTPGICHAVFPRRRALVPAVRKLIDFLAENLSGAEPHEVDYSI